VGNVAYAGACFVVAGYCVVGVSTLVDRRKIRPKTDGQPVARA
jgi:hypothetical protein